METTEASGEFTVGGVAPGGEVTIEAQRFERMTAEPVKATAGGTDPVIVTIVPGQTLALAGRVLGPGGTPVAGASLKVEFRKVESDGRLPYPQPFRFEDSVEVLTGPDGTFQTPKELSRKARDFRVETTAEGFLSKESGWVSSAGGDRVTVPDLTLRRSLTLRFLSGRVVDRAGTGVAGASVYQSGNTLRRTATTTDSEGRFRLAGVPDAAAFVFAEKPGYRFGGTIVKPADAQVDVRLARVDEPPLSMPKSLPPLLTRAEDRAMAKELLAPRVDAAPSGKAVLATPAWLDPDRLLEMLENRVLEDPSQVLIQIAVAQLETDPDAAVATIELDHDPASRAEGFLAVADATPITERGTSYQADRARPGRDPARRDQQGDPDRTPRPHRGLLARPQRCRPSDVRDPRGMVDHHHRAARPSHLHHREVRRPAGPDRPSHGADDLGAEGASERRRDRRHHAQPPLRRGRGPPGGDQPGRGRAAGPCRRAGLLG